MDFSPQFPLQPKRRLVSPRNWGMAPEERMTSHILYRRTRYGQAEAAPPTHMLRQMRKQQEFRKLD
jgi:hypothetical protein